MKRLNILLFLCICLYAYTSLAGIAISDSTYYQIISRGEAAGEYQAFPDACRLQNGDIVAVFYAGQGHVTYPDEQYPKGGRICMVRSQDEGQSWSDPQVIYDDAYDNRDPHISQLKDGTLLLSFFSLEPKKDVKKLIPQGVHLLRSFDNGKSWEEKPHLIVSGEKNWFCSAPVRAMEDGTLIFPVYYQLLGSEVAYGGVLLSNDQGKSWGDIIPIGKEADLFLAAETDVIRLRDGSLFAALRGQNEVPMHYAISNDMGKSWSEAKSIGFFGHSPHLTRLSSGEILLVYRGTEDHESFNWDIAYTALRISYDDGKSWQGPTA